MKYLLSILLISSICLTQEMEVDGNLKVTGTIQNDSLAQVIANLQAQITVLQAQLAQLDCINNGNFPEGYCDCYGSINDACGNCGGDTILEDDCFITDIDGNSYVLVSIGDQMWMAENLRTTRFKNGSGIDSNQSTYPSNQDNASAAMCGSDCSEVFGKLYDFWTVEHTFGVCMEGWHVPSDDDWKELELFLGMSPSEVDEEGLRGTGEGSELAGNDVLWLDGLLEDHGDFGTSGFTALPSGYRNPENDFLGMGEYTAFWSSTPSNDGFAWRRALHYSTSNIDRVPDNVNHRFPIRCIKD